MAGVLNVDVPTLCRAVSDNSERVYGPWDADANRAIRLAHPGSGVQPRGPPLPKFDLTVGDPPHWMTVGRMPPRIDLPPTT